MAMISFHCCSLSSSSTYSSQGSLQERGAATTAATSSAEEVFSLLVKNKSTKEIGIELNISEDFRLWTYYLNDSEEEEFNRFLTEPRFGMVDGKLLWDEYDSYNNKNYLYEIVEIGEDSFTLNSEGHGLQTYTRMKE